MEPRPVYVFKQIQSEEPEYFKKSRTRLLFIGAGVLGLGVFIIAISWNPPPVTYSPVRSTPIPQPSAHAQQITASSSEAIPSDRIRWAVTHPVACPQAWEQAGRYFERCLAVELPTTGEWVRRWNIAAGLPGTTWQVPSYQNVQARGCNGETYLLETRRNPINDTCGYIDYRSMDNKLRLVTEGHNPRPAPR